MANDQKRTQTVKRLSKSAIWKQVQELIVKHKIGAEAATELAMLLEPKAGGGSSLNPPKLDKDGNITEAWCKYHQTYEPIENMVVSNGKPKGYCKAAASKSNKLRQKSKDLDKEVIALISAGEFEKAQEKAKEAKELTDTMNSPELYNLEEDWAEFNGTAKSKDEEAAIKVTKPKKETK